MSLPIHEEFHSWQGEGCHMGRSAYFVRTMGCPVRCPWCDSAGTWNPKLMPRTVSRTRESDIAMRAGASGSEFTVVTGGEPTIHDLRVLTSALNEVGQSVHLETCGGFPIRGEIEWITLSPKRWKPPLPEIVKSADEFKVIVDSKNAIDEALELLGDSRSETKPVWLHPEWSIRTDPEILSLIDRKVRDAGAPFRAGSQIHKLYEVR